MNLLIVVIAFALLGLLLGLLGLWQRRIEEAQNEEALTDLRDAEKRGTDRPIAQHPLIDVQACIGCGTCIAACPEERVLGLVDGVARVIHGSRCIGHGRCADACPVGAVTIGLGDVSDRTDIPVLSDAFETSVPGVFIAGELGGFALIRIAIEQGARAVAAIANDLRTNPSPAPADALDLLIVGAGPAGIAASLKATELGLRYTTIDQEDTAGTIRKYPRRKLTLTGAMELPLFGRIEQEEFIKEDLIEFFDEIINHYHLRIETGRRLEGVTPESGSFVAQTSHGPIRTKRVLLALGRRGTPKRLGVPGEEAEKVLYQLVDTVSYRNEHILVVGGGDSAIEAATGLANQPGNVVTLSYRRENFFRLKSRNEERVRTYSERGKLRVLFNSQVKEITPDSVELELDQQGIQRSVLVKNDSVFVFAGGDPPYPLLEGIGVAFGGTGEPVVSRGDPVAMG